MTLLKQIYLWLKNYNKGIHKKEACFRQEQAFHKLGIYHKEKSRIMVLFYHKRQF